MGAGAFVMTWIDVWLDPGDGDTVRGRWMEWSGRNCKYTHAGQKKTCCFKNVAVRWDESVDDEKRDAESPGRPAVGGYTQIEQAPWSWYQAEQEQEHVRDSGRSERHPCKSTRKHGRSCREFQ
jgi:hypothetical protein